MVTISTRIIGVLTARKGDVVVELDMRKMRILAAIVDDYILTAMPVGSRTISKHPDINLSSATIRNEMSDLEELGYLEQPHTSAGRIPSDKAYRLYVDSLMRHAMLSDNEIRYIDDHFSQKADEVEEIIKQTAWVLSNMTKYTSIVLSPQLHAVRIKHVQLVPVSEGKALCVIVTDAGIVRDSIVRVPHGVAVEELEKLSRILTERLRNARMDKAVKTILPALSGEFSEHRDFLRATLESMKQGMRVDAGRVALSGTTNMLNYPEYSDMDKAKGFLSIIETKDKIYDMLSRAAELEFTVTIGTENKDADMQDCSVVTATYRVGDDPIGSLGIIGPTRMDYSRVMAILSYMGKSLSDIFTNMFEEEHER